MSVSIQLADALVTRLNTPGEPGFSQSFTAVRRYVPVFDLEKASGIQVTVVPKSSEVSRASRGSSFFDCAADIAVQKKVSGDLDADELDNLMALVEEIIDCVNGGPLTEYPTAVLVSIENAPIFAQEHLNEKRVFTSLLTATYRVMR